MEVSPEVQAKLDQIARLPRAVRHSILAGVAILAVAGYFFGIHQDLDMQLSDLRARELELQRKLSEVRSVAANIAAFEEEIGELEIQLRVAVRQLPNEKQIEVLLTDISNLGKTAGIEMKSFSRKPENVHDFYAEVPIAITLEGEYHEVARFFDLMSKLPRIVNMGSLQMKVGSENSERTLVKVSGTATTFRFVGKS